MPVKDLGNKFNCYKCGTKFYDLRKPEPICPKCGADQRQSPANKPASSRKSKEKEPVVAVSAEEPEAVAEDEDTVEDVEVEDEDEEEEDDDF
jgi:uncharacterized protein (TIGR02300 family)